jgi:hypothetical protein
MQQQPIQYVSKHSFQGDVRQAQLSFGPGTVITAKPGQEGAWWWGSCNGKEGWFPPTYVAPNVAPVPQQGPPLAAFQAAPQQQQQQQHSKQQLMQQATFTSSVQQRQAVQQAQPRSQGPPPNAFGGGPPAAAFHQQQRAAPSSAQGGGGVPSQQQQQQQQQSYEPSDPFAGLDSMSGPSPMTLNPTATATPPPGAMGGLGSMQSQSAPSSSQGAPAMQTKAMPMPAASSTTSVSSTTSAAATAVPKAAAPVDNTTAAFARMGVNAPVAAKPAAAASASASKAAVPPPAGLFSAAAKAEPAAATKAPPAGLFGFGAAKQQSSSEPAPTNSVPQRETKEEEQARKLREQEDVKQKALMRKEKEEIRQMQLEAAKAEASSGMGTSGVSLEISASGGVEVGMVPHGGFNPFDFLTGTSGTLPDRKYSPIFSVPPFWALLNLNTYIHQKPVPKEMLENRAANYEQLGKALSFVGHVCVATEKECRGARGRFSQRGQQQESPLAFLRSNHLACEACVKLMSLLPHSAGASGQVLDGLFLNFLNVFISLIQNLPPHQQLVLPGGWQQPEYTYLMLYIIRNCGNGRWSFTVCNTGRDGLQYHPASFDPETGRELKQLAMTVWDIPKDRVLDSTFWTLLFRMQVYPSRKNNAAFLYTKLLPSLNSRPLLSNLDQGPAEYLEVPHPIAAQSYHPLAILALTSTPSPVVSRTSKYSTLLLMNAAVDLAYAEIANVPPSSMDPEDSRILKLAGRNLANFASTVNSNTVGDGTLGASLSDTWDLLDKLLKKINFASSKPMDQYSHGLSATAMNDDFSKGKILSLHSGAGSAAHPLFGRLRRDGYDEVVKNLMGDPRPDPILIPAVLTDETLPPVATDYMNATSYLQRIADACSLLLQQRRLIKNSPAFAASAAQHALMIVLPMPNSDPQFCFWRKAEMRRETQLNLLFLIRRLCRIYSAATACVQQSRGLIAIRSTAFACAACVADAICRAVAVDDPSTFALHYSGLCEGPTESFGIQAGAFDTLGANLPLYDPNICSLRFQCLDYLRGVSLNMDGTEKNTIFNFDKSLSPMAGDNVLISQLSIQLALQRPFPATEQALTNNSANLTSARNGSVIEVLPEFEYFRDIVFHFKHAVSGKAQTAEVPASHTWLASDATLHWELRRKDKDDPTLLYHVTAFQGHHQDFVERIAQQEKKESKPKAFLGFISLFASKSKIERSRLSSADATTVVNSCGEKFLNKRYVLADVLQETMYRSCLTACFTLEQNPFQYRARMMSYIFRTTNFRLLETF